MKQTIWTNPKNNKRLPIKILGSVEFFGRTPEKGKIFVQKTTAKGINGIFSANINEISTEEVSC